MNARFVHYFKALNRSLPMYDLNGTTISQGTLSQMGLAVPLTPTYQTWVRLVNAGKRCGVCWETINGHHIHEPRHV